MKGMRSGGLILSVSYIAVGVAFTHDVRAQQQAGNPDQLEVVVVTAEKRNENIQNTPISITALTGTDLQDRGITDLMQIVQDVPGLSMRTSGPGQTELALRGMTSSGGNSSTVGFYLEDVPLSAPASAQNGKVVIDPALYDLNHVEVLRGPQGTLYGAGSMGGTVKLVPNSPNSEKFDASAQVVGGYTHGGDFNEAVNLMLNFPLVSDTLALRVVGSQEHVSGWIDRVVVSEPNFPGPVTGTQRGDVAAAPVAQSFPKINNEDLLSTRGTLLWTPADRVSVGFTYLYQKITQDGLSDVDSQPGASTALANYQPFNAPEPFFDQINLYSLPITIKLGWADLTSTTAYWARDTKLQQDGAEEVSTVFGLPSIYAAAGGFGNNSPTSLEDDKSWQTSEELRLTSTGTGPFKWLAGWFYQDFESEWNLWVYTPQAQQNNLAGVPVGLNGFGQLQPTKLLQNSFFANASYQFLSTWTATVGARRFYYSGEVNSTQWGWLSGSGCPDVGTCATPLNFITSEKDQGWTPMVQISDQVDPELLLYATAAKGFRPGGGNQPVPSGNAGLGPACFANLQAIGLNSTPLGFAPDSVWSYELGEKFRNADGKVTFNVDAYFEHWEDIQQNVPLPCGYPFTYNGASAHVYGGEVELDALIAPGLLFLVQGGLSHARYISSFVPLDAITIDSRVQNVPDWDGSASLAYRQPLQNGMAGFARIDYVYMGSRIDTTAQPNYISSYDLINLRFGLEAAQWAASLFVNNVTNKTALLTNAPAINVNVGTFNRVTMAQPLTFGIDLSYRFGAK